MSAIAGVVGLDDRPIAESDLRPVMGILAPFGGDGGGIWAGCAERSGAAGRSGHAESRGVAVGAVCRIRVPQDETDAQPVVAAGGQIVVVADAILDNRAELCRDLGLADAADLTDSELIAQAYLYWGRRCPRYLLGEFAFAVVDRRSGGVLLARDQVGSRPLHLFCEAGRVCFASTALAVTGFAEVPAVIDLERVKEYLALLKPSGRSWIQDVRPVPPATSIWITRAGPESETYWRLDTTPRTDVDFADCVEEVAELFDQAVRCRMRGRGWLGVALSGGLDSTSVAAAVATLAGSEPVRTYTSVPPLGWSGPMLNGWEPDESALVFALAERHPSLRPMLIDARGRSVFAEDDDTYALGGTPVRNILNMTWIRAIRERAAMDGVGRLYTGSIGNSTFSIDDMAWLMSLLRSGRIGHAAREAVAWSRARGLSLPRAAYHFGLLEAVPNRVRRMLVRMRKPSWHERASGLSALRPDLLVGMDLSTASYAGGADIRDRARTLPLVGLAGTAGAAEIRAASEARWGLRLIDPTAELRLVEACARQPSWVRRRLGMSRAVARAATRDRLPDCIRLRHERGQQLPDWLDRATDAYAEFAGELAAAAGHGTSRQLIDVERLEVLVRSWPDPGRAGEAGVVDKYLLMLPAALAASHYLRWFDQWSGTRSKAAATAVESISVKHP